MDPKVLSRKSVLTLLILLAISLGGCELGDFSNRTNSERISRLLSWKSKPSGQERKELIPGAYPIDLTFTDFYLAFGGEETLGPAISIATTENGVTKQYTDTGLMIFNPHEPEPSRFSFAPLGLELGTAGGELLGKAYVTGRIIAGHLVIADFLEEYERLGGARFVGKPIGEAQYNTEKGRIEQYFENLGFYKLDGESRVRLMSYGAYACDRNCRQQDPVAGIPVLQTVIPDTFLKKTLELGLPIVGKPLTGVHYDIDGNQEVIFENIVLVAEDDFANEVGIRPIVEQIGEYRQDPTESQDSPLSEFYEVNNGIGYDVPLYFVEFLNANGGLQIAGDPISHVFSPEPGVFWQCFTNLCLEFNLNEDGAGRLRLVPIGVDYKNKQFKSAFNFEQSQSLEQLEIKVWERDSYVSSNDSQEINVAIYQSNSPLSNFEPLLLVTMPDGSQRKAYFQPSSENGCTSIELAPIDAPNGTLIAYKVCLFGMDGEPKCVGDNYLIWDTD
jgi:hypothetical protein